jgi:hypothetical protein
MPFDLWLSRSTTPAEFAERGVRPGPSFSLADFNRLMSDAPADATPDGVYRVRRPRTREPWFTARFEPRPNGAGGDIALGTSYTSPRFARDWGDSFDMALQLAPTIGARVFEEYRGTELTARNVDDVLDRAGPYVRHHLDLHKQCFDDLCDAGGVPMEYALGGTIDRTSHLFCFHVPGAAIPALRLPSNFNIQRIRPDAIVIEDAMQPLLRVYQRPDGRLQVWNGGGRAPFSTWAPLALEVLDQLGGKSEMLGRGPFEGPLRQRVEALTKGLGCDFVAWSMGHTG